jgi:hypothetical protein
MQVQSSIAESAGCLAKSTRMCIYVKIPEQQSALMTLRRAQEAQSLAAQRQSFPSVPELPQIQKIRVLKIHPHSMSKS